MTATMLPIPTDNGDIPGLLWLPPDLDSTDRSVPGVVVLQEIFGLTGYIQQRCAQLAELGYAVLAPQLFARLDPPVVGLPDSGDFESWLGAGMALTQALPWERAEADTVAALDALRSHEAVDGDRVGIMGFCYGGGLAFSATATANAQGQAPAVLVSYYGSALPTLLERAGSVSVPSLHVFGTDDAFIPMEQVERIREAVTAGGTREKVRFELHEGAGHAFDNPHPALHHAEAAQRAWMQTRQFLAKELPTG